MPEGPAGGGSHLTEDAGEHPVSEGVGGVLPPGTVVAGRYEIRRLLGCGSSGLVYAAHDRPLGAEVALKVLRPDRLTERALKRIRREVRIAREGSSARLLRVYDLEEADGLVFLTMELVEGTTLRDRMAGPLPVGEAVPLVTAILEGLAALHALGVVHRDVKPANVLLTPDGTVKLGDFGLALWLDTAESRVTEASGFVGTAEYVSPEQALGKEIDARSDLFSVGAVLYEMLAGKPPWHESSSLGTITARLNRPAPDVRSAAPRTPGWLAGIVARLLEVRPSDRYASAAEVLADLGRRPSLGTRVRRALLRRRTLAAAAVVVLLGASLAGLLAYRSSRFARLEGDGANGTRALDGKGRVLWRNPTLDFERLAVVYRRRGGATGVAGLPWRSTEPPHAPGLLSILDPQTGATRREIPLPDYRSAFPRYADLWRPMSVRAVDVLGEGRDQILVSFMHWKDVGGYTALVDPATDRSKVVYASSGDQRFAGAADVDGDGQAELVFTGINNALGWYNAVAVVRPFVRPSDRTAGASFALFAASPDRPSANLDLLSDYVLLPRGEIQARATAAVIDASGRRLRVHLTGRSPVDVDLTGCGLARPGPAGCAALRDARRRAFAHVREALRVMATGFSGRAVEEAAAADADARAASDPILAEAARRLEGRALIRAGRTEEGEALFEGLMASENAPEIAHDAAVAFHLSDHPRRAAAWYMKAFSHGDSGEGRSRFYYVAGAVMADVEAGRWQEAEADIRAFEAEAALASPRTPWGDELRAYVAWRQGKPRDFALVEGAMLVELAADWKLEVENALGEDAAVLLRKADDPVTSAVVTPPLLLSLKGELLSRLGRDAEALATARKAWQEARETRTTDVGVHAHFDLIGERFARLAARAGLAREADEALAEVRAIRERERVRVASGALGPAHRQRLVRATLRPAP